MNEAQNAQYQELRARADKLFRAADSIKSNTLRIEVRNLLCGGAENADDTIFVEKAAPLEDWDWIFAGSIASTLCCNQVSKQAAQWLARRGIKA
jgi:hypothetical protein